MSSTAPIEPYPRQPVEFLAYDPRAPEAAQYVIDLIQARVPGVTVEHVGSTAVPGCAGRGAIDLMVLYSSAPIEPILAGLDALGFQWVQRNNDLPNEWPKGAGAVRYQDSLFRLHIHVQPVDHPTVAEKRAFRDRLRADPNLRAEYMARKQAILKAGITDPIEYTAAKAGFVQQALDE
jgi:GrpB-like predicted nucleotidyltransferase (UPF0157 family)